MSKELPKLYSMTSISIASALGSILAGGYMLYSNYRVLGMNQYSGYIFALCAVIFLIFMGISSSMAPEAGETMTVNTMWSTFLVLSVAQGITGTLLTHFSQGGMLETFKKEMRGTYQTITQSFLVIVSFNFIVPCILIALLFPLGLITGQNP